MKYPAPAERGTSVVLSSESEWFIYQIDGAPLGPLSTSAIVEAILAGNLPPDVWIAAPGGTKWLCAKNVPVIAKLIDGLPTKRQSGMRMVTAPIPSKTLPRKIDDTIKTADLMSPPGQSEPEPPAITIRSTSSRGPDGFPIPPPPSSSNRTPRSPEIYRGGETLESPGQERPRKTQGC